MNHWSEPIFICLQWCVLWGLEEQIAAEIGDIPLLQVGVPIGQKQSLEKGIRVIIRSLELDWHFGWEVQSARLMFQVESIDQNIESKHNVEDGFRGLWSNRLILIIYYIYYLIIQYKNKWDYITKESLDTSIDQKIISKL